MEWKSTDKSTGEERHTEQDYDEEKPYSPWLRDRISLGLFKNRRTAYISAGAGLFILLILLVMLIPNSRKTETDRQIAALEAKFSQLEDRLFKLEGIDERLKEIVGLGSELEIFKGRLGRLEALETSMTSRMDRIAKNMDALQKKSAVTQAKKASPVNSRKASTQRAKMRYHQVRTGDTLYSIGRRYGISVNELRRLNNLGSGAVIHPGQKLKLGPARKK